MEPGETSVRFAVWACANVKILLATNKQINENSYEITIGSRNGHTTSIIRNDGQDTLHEVHTEDVLKEACNDDYTYKWMWIRWVDGYMEVGDGSSVGRNQLLDRR